MGKYSLLFYMCLLGLFSSAARAEDLGRYQLGETETGIVRLDTVTGELTYCKNIGKQLRCDEPVSEIQTLNARIERLEIQLGALQAALKAGSHSPSTPLIDKEIDRGLVIMEKFFDSFLGFVDRIEKRTDKKGAPLPKAT